MDAVYLTAHTRRLGKGSPGEYSPNTTAAAWHNLGMGSLTRMAMRSAG